MKLSQYQRPSPGLVDRPFSDLVQKVQLIRLRNLPLHSLPRLIRTARNFLKSFIERQVVSNQVLPPGFAVFVVGVVRRDPVVDFQKQQDPVFI